MLKYLKSREFWLTLLGLVVLAGLIFAVVFYWFLPSYTRHGESVIVPEVTEVSLDEAIGILEEKDLRHEVADSIFISNLPPGSVISQDPSGMSKVKPGRRIYLTVNKLVPPKVRIPEIYNVSTYQAKLLLEGAGLKIKRIEYIPDEFKNLVRYGEFEGKRVKPGDTLPKFSELVLYAGRGLGSQRVGIPDLVGLPYQEAISNLHRVGLNVGPIRFNPEAPEPVGTVIRQNPSYIPGDSTNLGTSMTLFIAGPEPEDPIEYMDFEGDGEAEEEENENEEDNDRSVRSVPTPRSVPNDTSSDSE